jgi:ATP-binding cassette subfamily B protein/subfamily B ATP-binding cassette protein MsbA
MFHQHLTVASFMTYIFSLGLLLDSVRRMQDAYIRVQQAAIGMDRLHDILEAPSTVADVVDPKPFPKEWNTIEFRNVTFSYKDEPVLKNVNLTIRRSEVVALVGSSGSGKSTIANLLQRFFDPQEGEILINGIPIRKMRMADLRRNIALVTQDVFLFNDSIERNIQLGNLEKDEASVLEASKLANAHNFIMSTPQGYKTSVGDFGSRISGGEKQRISIARAILKDAPILVLDEATSALDSESELEVQKGLNQLLEGRTALVIAHRLSTIAKATRIVVLKKGQIVEEGSHTQLLAQRGEYFKFHEMQHGH